MLKYEKHKSMLHNQKNILKKCILTNNHRTRIDAFDNERWIIAFVETVTDVTGNNGNTSNDNNKNDLTATIFTTAKIVPNDWKLSQKMFSLVNCDPYEVCQLAAGVVLRKKTDTS